MKESTKLQLGDWYTEFKPFWNSPGMNEIIQEITKEYQTKTVYPEPKNIFKAFELCPFSSLKAVILGMDPYNDGQALGLAFGVNSTKINPSLKKIHEAIEQECYNGLLVEFDYTLEYLARQGVLLLNTALTVRKGEPGSHMKIWEPFTQGLLALISCKKDVIWFLWGKHAEKMKDCIYGTPEMYITEHPSYAARHGRPWLTNGQFYKTQDIIKW